VADEDHRAARAHSRALKCARDREHDGEPAAVVANPGAVDAPADASRADVGGLGEDSVEVAGDHHRRAGTGAGPLADRVPFRVDADISQAERGEATPVLRSAPRLAEGRSRDLAE
jgi:hypothetical protein